MDNSKGKVDLRADTYRKNQTVIQTVNTIGKSTALQVAEIVLKMEYSTLASECSHRQ